MSNRAPEPSTSDSLDGEPCPGQPVIEFIDARRSIVGDGLPVQRALPTRTRRTVGAWCFLDHAGPLDHEAGGGLSVGPHPHIGLQTFTWMIEGEVMHHDSLRHQQMIRPGQVNLMTAGRGISHAEISPTDEPGRVHAAQLWIALPKGEHDREPAFEHHPELPRVDLDGFVATVLAGKALGESAPPKVYSPLVGLDLTCQRASSTSLSLEPRFEHAALCLEGECEVAGQQVVPGRLLYLGLGRDAIDIAARAPARLLVIGGEPFDEEILLWWNFVARTQEEMVQATQDWQAGRRFGQVPGTDLPRLEAPDISTIRLRRPAAR